MAPSWPVVTADEMRALETAAFASGISESQLQRNAAAEVALLAGKLAPRGTRVVVMVGPGNNGRDAFLAGRLLAERGRWVFFYLASRHAVLSDELADLRPPIERARVEANGSELSLLEIELSGARIAIDGLLGIGVRGPMRAPLDSLARVLNQASATSSLHVVSVDVPSGIDADSGDVPGEAVKADLTIALGAVKAGCLRFPAASYAGQIEPRPIGLPAGVDADSPVRLLTAADVAAFLPERPPQAHKAMLGWVMVVGGSREYVGAPVLSAAAAARSGCGLVALGVPPNVQAAAAVALPEATFALRDTRQVPEIQAERLIARLDSFKALVIGPGLGRDEQGDRLARALLGSLNGLENKPATIIDADALNGLSGWPKWWTELPPGCVLTPHHGEMARLTGLSSAEIGSRSWEAALEHATRWGQIVVLKGAHTVVAAPAGLAWVYPRPNPGLATAGSGDILAGLIGGLAAQGCSPLEASRLAVVAHALAAERVMKSQAWRSLIASDLLTGLPEVLGELGRGHPDP